MKRTVLYLLTFCCVSSAFSQSESMFHIGTGIGAFSLKSPEANDDVVVALGVSPRIDFLDKKQFTLSVGVPLTAGFSLGLSDQSAEGSGGLGYMLSLPLLIDLNVGAGSSYSNENRFGFFVGAGFGYQHEHLNQTDYDGYGNAYNAYSTVNSYGPAADAGLRIHFGEWWSNLELRAQYMKGIDASKTNTLGFMVVWDL